MRLHQDLLLFIVAKILYENEEGLRLQKKRFRGRFDFFFSDSGGIDHFQNFLWVKDFSLYLGGFLNISTNTIFRQGGSHNFCILLWRVHIQFSKISWGFVFASQEGFMSYSNMAWGFTRDALRLRDPTTGVFDIFPKYGAKSYFPIPLLGRQ